MPQYVIEITRTTMIGLPGDPPIGPIEITTRSRPFLTREAADTIAAVIRRNSKCETRVVCE